MVYSTAQRRARRLEAFIIGAVCLVVAQVGGWGGRCFGVTQVTTTNYLYNADGALTAVTTQVDARTPATVYLTWDNFVPDTADPTVGTVLAGNGNLLGFGPQPGSAFTTQFAYDQRNRLTSAAAAGAQSVSYTYYPAHLMAASTLASGDVLQFFYDAASPPQATNITHSSTATWSSYLGDVTYLSDGTEQARCTPRKDMAGVYEPAQQSFSPNRYDPYGSAVGAATTTASAASYDLAQNPFLYAAEYEDPSWGGYYLRARWYLPAYQTFLGRDPTDPMHRYSYSAGNPVTRVDPSGLHWDDRGAGKFLKDLYANANGPRGALSRFFLGGIIGVTQLLANPSGYWHELKHDTSGMDIFLAAGVLAEVGTTGWGFLPELPGSALQSFGARHLIDATLGIGQSVASGFSGHRRFDWAAVGQGMEYTAGGMFWGREVGGIGYKPYAMTTDDVAELAAKHFANGDHSGEMLVFRVRKEESSLLTRGTSPLREWRTIGGYHESVVAVGPDWSLSTEVTAEDAGSFVNSKVETRWNVRSKSSPLPYMRYKTMMFVGSYRLEDVERAFGLENEVRDPNSLYNSKSQGTHRTQYYKYGTFKNNCHDYARRVVGALGN